MSRGDTVSPGRAPGTDQPPAVTPPRGLRLRLQQAPNIVLRSVRHPVWMAETARGVMRRRREARWDLSLIDFTQFLTTERDAAAAVTGRPPSDYDRVCREVSDLLLPSETERPLFAGSAELVRLAAAIVRMTRPEKVLETGVGQGVTTAALLAVLERNGHGHLFSVDLPPLHVGDDFVGRMVPDRLKGRWSLGRGPSRQLLPSLLERERPLDVFLHDAEHSYASQLEEYEWVWPHLKAGGPLLSDDVGNNPAFLEFAEAVGERPYLVEVAGSDQLIGLLRRSC